VHPDGNRVVWTAFNERAATSRIHELTLLDDGRHLLRLLEDPAPNAGAATAVAYWTGTAVGDGTGMAAGLLTGRQNGAIHCGSRRLEVAPRRRQETAEREDTTPVRNIISAAAADVFVAVKAPGGQVLAGSCAASAPQRSEEGLRSSDGGLRSSDSGPRSPDGGLRSPEGGLRSPEGGLRSFPFFSPDPGSLQLKQVRSSTDDETQPEWIVSYFDGDHQQRCHTFDPATRRIRWWQCNGAHSIGRSAMITPDGDQLVIERSDIAAVRRYPIEELARTGKQVNARHSGESTLKWRSRGEVAGADAGDADAPPWKVSGSGIEAVPGREILAAALSPNG